jgi:hypothetical protein
MTDGSAGACCDVASRNGWLGTRGVKRGAAMAVSARPAATALTLTAPLTLSPLHDRHSTDAQTKMRSTTRFHPPTSSAVLLGFSISFLVDTTVLP